MTENKQIKSKERVAEHGEVFTNQREVNAMLDLVKQETERIDSRFLEPACGDGNFLAEILNRKLTVCTSKYGNSHADWEKYSVIAVSSIYGVDIMEDNAKECRNRLYEIWDKAYSKACGKDCNDLCCESVKYILSKNILYGDALTMKQNDGKPIIFAQWDFVMGNLIKRADYRLDELLEGQDKHKGDHEVLSLFGDDENNFEHPKDWIYDDETKAYIPAPIKEYPPTDYRQLKEVK
ncbi:MAG: SAM-dependent DNA methyltransferase [Prevotella sp.]|jgi:hypothetical protein|nr:SAM-dependent DNA methyltransferase [Prevotella sp.]MCH4183408.1 SAM-dependent DNA methyltransferase [Prevotella sp.]